MAGTEVALFESVALFLQMTDAGVMDRERRREEEEDADHVLNRWKN